MLYVKHKSKYDPRWIALYRETYLSERLMTRGLCDLLYANLFNQDLYYSSFFSITIAFERICKLVLNSDRYTARGTFLSDRQLRDEGHDLKKLYNKVVEISRENRIPVIEIGKKNEKILEFLTDFAKSGRYYNFVTLGGGKSTDPIVGWRKIVGKTTNDAYCVDRKKCDEMLYDERTLCDMHFFDEEGKNVESDSDCEESLKETQQIQINGLRLVLPLIINIVTCLDSYSEKSINAESDAENADKCNNMEAILKRIESQQKFMLPNYAEFYQKIRRMYEYCG